MSEIQKHQWYLVHSDGRDVARFVFDSDSDGVRVGIKGWYGTAVINVDDVLEPLNQSMVDAHLSVEDDPELAQYAWSAPRSPECEGCDTALAEAGEYYDVRIPEEDVLSDSQLGWSCLCERCFSLSTARLSRESGQRYRRVGPDRWLLVGGHERFYDDAQQAAEFDGVESSTFSEFTWEPSTYADFFGEDADAQSDPLPREQRHALRLFSSLRQQHLEGASTTTLHARLKRFPDPALDALATLVGMQPSRPRRTYREDVLGRVLDGLGPIGMPRLSPPPLSAALAAEHSESIRDSSAERRFEEWLQAFQVRESAGWCPLFIHSTPSLAWPVSVLEDDRGFQHLYLLDGEHTLYYAVVDLDFEIPLGLFLHELAVTVVPTNRCLDTEINLVVLPTLQQEYADLDPEHVNLSDFEGSTDPDWVTPPMDQVKREYLELVGGSLSLTELLASLTSPQRKLLIENGEDLGWIPHRKVDELSRLQQTTTHGEVFDALLRASEKSFLKAARRMQKRIRGRVPAESDPSFW